MSEKLLVVVDNRMLILHMLLEYRFSFKMLSTTHNRASKYIFELVLLTNMSIESRLVEEIHIALITRERSIPLVVI